MQAMTSRFLALVGLAKKEHLQSWMTAQNREGVAYLHPSLAYAACNATLLFRGDVGFFQPVEFLNLALQDVPNKKPFPR